MSVRSGKTHTLRFLQTFKIKKASQNNEEDTKKNTETLWLGKSHGMRFSQTKKTEKILQRKEQKPELGKNSSRKFPVISMTINDQLQHDP